MRREAAGQQPTTQGMYRGIDSLPYLLEFGRVKRSFWEYWCIARGYEHDVLLP